jgi:hypothetical protein
MRRIAVTMTIETDIEDVAELGRVLRAALDQMAYEPYLDYFDLALEPVDEEGGQD